MEQRPRSPALRVLLLALSPFPLAEGLVGRVLGSSVLAITTAVLLRIFGWPDAIAPILFLLVLFLWRAGTRLQLEIDETLGASVAFGEPQVPHPHEHIAL